MLVRLSFPGGILTDNELCAYLSSRKAGPDSPAVPGEERNSHHRRVSFYGAELLSYILTTKWQVNFTARLTKDFATVAITFYCAFCVQNSF